MDVKQVDCSIIIPVHDLELYISPMLNSLKAQDFGRYSVEIIFVLTCTDKSEEVIRESGLTCRIIYCEERGCGIARNKGLDAASGKYIWFLDGDDWLLSDTAVKDVIDRAERDNLDILYIPFRSDVYKQGYFSMVWQYLLRKDFVKDIRFNNGLLDEDVFYTKEVLKKVNADPYTYTTLPSMPKPLYYYNFMRKGSNMYKRLRGEPL